MMKVGILLSGSGVYDGSEIHESVFALLSILENGGEPHFIAPDVAQMHVVNHLTGEEMKETRNVLIESARIARGDIEALTDGTAEKIDALVLPGGFGTAKNHTNWAVKGPESEIVPEVKKLIIDMVSSGKPIVALCMAPTTIAKALEGTEFSAKLTVGTIEEPSPYDIDGISQGISAVGSQPEMKTVREVLMDKDLKIITAPCYMMEASPLEVRQNIDQAIGLMFGL